MFPLSTLIEVLKDYDNDPSFDPDCDYDVHLLAAFIVMQGFEKMKEENLPQAAQLTAATILIQSWCSQDPGCWATTYSDGESFTTELMDHNSCLVGYGRASSMAQSIINAAEQIKL